MSTPIKPNLLRRTTVALAAVAGLLIAADSTAATVILKDSQSGATLSTGTCTYSQMTVTPDGGINVACTGTVVTTTPTGVAGTFTVTGSTTALLGSPATPLISRGSASSGAFNVYYTTTGLGCATPGNYLIAIANGQSSVQLSVALTSAIGAQCTTILGALVQTDATAITSAAVIGSPSSNTVAVSSTPDPTPTPTPTPTTGLNFAGCPTGYAPPSDLITATLGDMGQLLKQMQKSQQIVAIPLPAGTNISQQVTLSESSATFTPSPVDIEISINKCPGLILPPADSAGNPQYCNLHSNLGQINGMTWFAQAYAGVIKDTASANVYGYCWAGDANSSYYINARWTYTSCMYNNSICGWLITHNNGPY